MARSTVTDSRAQYNPVRRYLPMEILPGRHPQTHQPGGSIFSMELDDASDETIARSYRHLVEFQEHVTTLEGEADGAEELESLIAELAHFHNELQDEVRERDLDDSEIVENARDESPRDR